MVSSGDPRKLLLVCDGSGSMSENGKPMLLRGVVRLVEQCLRFGYAAADLLYNLSESSTHRYLYKTCVIDLTSEGKYLSTLGCLRAVLIEPISAV